MHYERRHTIKGFKLTRHHKRIGRLLLRQVTCSLIARNLEQITHLPVQLDSTSWLRQHYKTK